MTIKYKEKEYTRFKEKTAGKNQSDIDGFYKNKDDENDTQRYFVKNPKNKRELFAEAFAGALLQELMDRNLIDEIYHPSLIVADVVRVDDGTGDPEYALIQPMVSFTEFYKDIGSGNSDNSDRSVLKEAYDGSNYYLKLLQDKQFGLSLPLMLSMLFSAHSVHSGNMVSLNQEHMVSKQRARLDWGDAFRFFAHEGNNQDLWYAYENRGLLNPKQLTKDYFLNYRKISGLFPKMALRAQELKAKLDEKILLDIVVSALKKLPEDFIDAKTKEKFAEYACMPSFKEVQLGAKSDGGEFAKAMAKLLASRLDKVCVLENLQKSEGDLYNSVVIALPPVLKMEEDNDFPTIVSAWQKELSKKGVDDLDIRALDLAQLANSFNDYLTNLAAQCEQQNIWEHVAESTDNIFVGCNTDNSGDALHGHAFVPQYKESVIFQRLCSINPVKIGMLRFAAYEKPTEEYAKQHADLPWTKLSNLATSSQNIVKMLKLLQRGQHEQIDGLTKEQLPILQEELKRFLQYKEEVDQLLKSGSSQKLEQETPEDSSFFYHITDDALDRMSGDQLATICLEELNAAQPSRLITRILKSEDYWNKIELSLQRCKSKDREDGVGEKIQKLQVWYQLLRVSDAMELKSKTEALKAAKEEAQSEQVKAKTQITELELEVQRLTETIETNETKLERILEQQILTDEQFKRQLETSDKTRREAEELVNQLNERVKLLDSNLQQQGLLDKQQRQKAQQEILDLKQEIETLKLQIEQDSEQHRVHVEKYIADTSVLKEQLSEVSREREKAEQTVNSLGGMLEESKEKQLVAEQKVVRLEHQLKHDSEESKKTETEHSEVIHQLTNELKAAGVAQSIAQEALTKLNSKLQKMEGKKLKAEKRIENLTKSVKSKEQQYGLLLAQLGRVKLVITNKDIEIDQLNKDIEIDQLNKDIAALKGELAGKNNAIQKLIIENEEAQKKFEKALGEKQDIQFARTLRIAPVLKRIRDIAAKAKELDGRNETKALNAANELVRDMNTAVRDYVNSEEDEANALANLKATTKSLINKADGDLGQHRKQWKVVIANLSLAILLVGVGYAAAMLINKAITNRYTFFGETDSKEKLKRLKNDVDKISETTPTPRSH